MLYRAFDRVPRRRQVAHGVRRVARGGGEFRGGLGELRRIVNRLQGVAEPGQPDLERRERGTAGDRGTGQDQQRARGGDDAAAEGTERATGKVRGTGERADPERARARGERQVARGLARAHERVVVDVGVTCCGGEPGAGLRELAGDALVVDPEVTDKLADGERHGDHPRTAIQLWVEKCSTSASEV
ncbi:hypothetical protein [Amycolatopsis nalaikhensis]|uniref:Uncharacterized protein n=1 Tax=Amycolatopsis nalaikhensis TaxID=715472 RepID=A0ABY8XTN3_9PSEU|nr:hypothetical protein [Amycolatopsis sp. 2-2]WIV59055.1 hypothetical protein QP939_10685 [Amycolatopsis sp. 2-2]